MARVLLISGMRRSTSVSSRRVPKRPMPMSLMTGPVSGLASASGARLPVRIAAWLASADVAMIPGRKPAAKPVPRVCKKRLRSMG